MKASVLRPATLTGWSATPKNNRPFSEPSWLAPKDRRWVFFGRDLKIPRTKRLFVDKIARIDTAFSDEDFRVQMMIGQPFQF